MPGRKWRCSSILTAILDDRNETDSQNYLSRRSSIARDGSHSALGILPMTALGMVLASLAASCSGPGPRISGDPGGVQVTASLYPLAYAASRVGGRCVEVTDLTPAGVEPHDLELTFDDVTAIAGADLVVYLGGGFQPAVEDAIGQAEGTPLDLLGEIDTSAGGPQVQQEPVVDPHVWLDPASFAAIVPGLAASLERVAPNADCDFEANGRALAEDLHALDAAFEEGLGQCEQTTLVTDHAAFGYLASAYGLRQESISGLEPDAEPTPGRLAELADFVRREAIPTIFSEETGSPAVVETLAAEAGAGTAILSTLETLTPQQIEAGQDYGSVMRSNLETLMAGLACG